MWRYSAMSLSIKVEKKTGFAILILRGKLDATTSPELDKKIKSLIKEGYKKLICDLKELSYISSAGVGVFSYAKSELIKQGGDIIFANAQKSVLNVINLLGFGKILKFYPTIEEAVNSIK